jgi:hypothetical protein
VERRCGGHIRDRGPAAQRYERRVERRTEAESVARLLSGARGQPLLVHILGCLALVLLDRGDGSAKRLKVAAKVSQ